MPIQVLAGAQRSQAGEDPPQALARPRDRRESLVGRQDDAQFPADRANRRSRDHVAAGRPSVRTARGAAASRRAGSGWTTNTGATPPVTTSKCPVRPTVAWASRPSMFERSSFNAATSTPTSRPSPSRSGAAIITAAP